MRRILLDEGVPVGIRRYLTGFSIVSVAEMGWAGLDNGDLIAAAETAGFDIMLTADQNIRYQQNLSSRRIALVVLDTNRWTTIEPATAKVQAAVDSALIGTYTVVSFDRPALLRRPPPAQREP